MTRHSFIVTGASSPLGWSICTGLLNAGHKVYAVCRNNPEALPIKAKAVLCPMDNYASLPKVIKKADVFINLAWEGTARGLRSDPKVQEANVEGAITAMKAAAAMGCKLFVESGSMEEYGVGEGGIKAGDGSGIQVSEDTVCHPCTEYGKAKFKVCNEAFRLCPSLGMKYLHLRMSCMYGSVNRECTLISTCLHTFLENEPMPLGLCEHKWNYIHVDDASKCILRLIEYVAFKEDCSCEIFNVCSPDTRTLKDFIESIRILCHSYSPLLYGKYSSDKEASLIIDRSKTVQAVGEFEHKKFETELSNVVDKKRGNILHRGIQWFQKRIHSKFIRFCFVGCLNAAFGYGVYCLCIACGLPFYLATLIGNILGVIWNFKTTGTIVFESRDNSLIWKFVFCYVINYFFNTGCVKFFLIFGLNEYWSGLAATAVSAVFSFLLLRIVVYRKRKVLTPPIFIHQLPSKTESCNMKKISIVTACFNEEENVDELYERIKAQFEGSAYDYEHLFIDNCSTDHTVEKVKALCKKDGHVRLIVNAMNFGHIRSPFHALLQADGDAVMLMVSDLQDPPELIPEFIHQWENGHQVVVGVKNKSMESPVMYALRGVYYKLIKAMSETRQIENFTGFGLYDKNFIKLLKSIDDPYPYMRGLVAEYGGNIAMIPYTQPKRMHGHTHQSFYTLYDMAMLGFVSHTKIPLRLSTFIGAGVCALSIPAMIALCVINIFIPALPLLWSLVLCLLFFLGGVILVFLGIIGEYVGATLTQVKHRPLVIEKERVNFPE